MFAKLICKDLCHLLAANCSATGLIIVVIITINQFQYKQHYNCYGIIHKES